MSELKPCPFCGSAPTFPDAKDTYGTCYEIECSECGYAYISLQIIDCFDHPRQHVHDSWNQEKVQYGIEYIEVARQEAIKAWNTRDNTMRDKVIEAVKLKHYLKQDIKPKEHIHIDNLTLDETIKAIEDVYE